MRRIETKLSLRRLRILREVAHHGGVTVAAHEMQYSPSGVSQQMAALEREIGAPVLERRGRGIVLTEVGWVLLEHAEILLAAERDAQSAVEQVRDTLAVELTVGVFSTVAAGLISSIVSDLALRHLEVRLRTRETDPDDVGVQLRHGHLDVAFLIDYPDANEPWSQPDSASPSGPTSAARSCPTPAPPETDQPSESSWTAPHASRADPAVDPGHSRALNAQT